ncbi:MAG: FtsX-like permease family protein [Lachnospiraceae bacterium]|nr:FtsX-like permease family protein [Lachnospiraceae bacterium]
MRIFDLFRMGLRNLFRRKARTLLTIIGVIIGTVSIVVMISVGIGMNESFEASVMENGSMTIINVSADSWEENENGEYTQTTQKLDAETVEKLRAIEHVKGITPIINNWSMQLYSGKYQGWANFIIMDMDCYEDFGYPALEDGTYPNKENSKDRIYMGAQAQSNEFNYWDGRRNKTKTIDFERDKIEIKFQDYQINPRKKEYTIKLSNIGKISQSQSGYSEADWSCFIDIDAYKEHYKKYANTLKIDDRKKALASLEKYERIMINVDNMNYVTEVQDEIEKLGLKSTSDMQYIQPMKETAEMLELVLGAIGAVAMLVSAINIANTMIMSIYERTKEIGIMKVLGCKVGDVRKLFLFEAGIIGLIGGLIGIGLSYIASWALNTYGGSIFESLMSGSLGVAEGSKFSVIPFWLPFFAAAFGMMVGVLSGFFPALRATKISAIEAMKSE